MCSASTLLFSLKRRRNKEEKRGCVQGTNVSPILLTEAPLARAQWRVGLGISSLCDTAIPVDMLKHTLTHTALKHVHTIPRLIHTSLLKEFSLLNQWTTIIYDRLFLAV